MSLSDQIQGNVVLTLGDAGPAVRSVQLALAAIGYQLTGTGYFGNSTDAAVTGFQMAAGITPDGDVGPETAAALDAATGAHPGNISDATHPPTKIKTVVAQVGRPLWLEAGLRLIGTKEAPGAKDNPNIIDWAKQEGGDISKEYDHDSVPWCALFADHCLRLADIKGPGTLWALDFAGKWPSVKLNGPAVGAFAPMLRSGGGHITIVVGRDQRGNVMGLGGNQSDAVNIEPFAVSRLNKGFWWPKSIALPAKTGINNLPIVLSNGQVSHNEA